MTSATGEGQERQDAPERAPARRTGRIPADTFRIRLRLVRIDAGDLTVKQAATKCGLNYGSWSKWERGARPHDILDVVQRISDGLDIDYEWLLFGGPLTGDRSRPTRRGSDHTTTKYQAATVRPTDNRPTGRTNHAALSGPRRPARVIPPLSVTSPIQASIAPSRRAA